MSDEPVLGFKKLTVANWLEGDTVLTLFVSLSPDGSIRSLSRDEWARRILEPQMNDSVPLEIRRLFEVARGTMLYGYLFYPIFTLASEQLYRVAESAVSMKYAAKGAPKGTRNFEGKINWLADHFVIAKSEKQKWHAIRGLRNLSSHPEQQTVSTPIHAVDMLNSIVQKINALFDSE